MLRLVSLAIAAVIAGSVTAANAKDVGEVRLATVAALDGYSYEWNPVAHGATLVRPGIRIVILAGDLFYEVNDSTPLTDRAPRFDGRDIIVSAKLAEHLRELALKYRFPSTPRPESYTVQNDFGVTAYSAASVVQSAPRVTVTANHIPGREALAIFGTAPPNTTVVVTLSGEMSGDLPVVALMTKHVTSGADGAFSTEVGYGQDTHPHTYLTVTAAVLGGTTSAPARVTIEIPSPEVSTPGLDVWPKK